MARGAGADGGSARTLLVAMAKMLAVTMHVAKWRWCGFGAWQWLIILSQGSQPEWPPSQSLLKGNVRSRLLLDDCQTSSPELPVPAALQAPGAVQP